MMLLLCPAAEVADKTAAVNVVEAEAVIVYVHLFDLGDVVCDGRLTDENIPVCLIDGILGIVHLANFHNISVTDKHQQILFIQPANLIRCLDVPSAG